MLVNSDAEAQLSAAKSDLYVERVKLYLRSKAALSFPIL